MARHHIWEPGSDEPPLLEWYAPLVELSRRARVERIHWPMLVEDFDVARRVDRHRATRVWTYRHRVTGGELHVDDAGATYACRPHPSAEAGGRFVSTPLRRVVYDAELHRQPEDLWYEFPGDRHQHVFDETGLFEEPGLFDEADVYDAPEPARRRGHLVLIPGG